MVDVDDSAAALSGILERRRQALKAWIDVDFRGAIVDFCRHHFGEKWRSQASYVSQILNGHRPLGERAARNLEHQCGKPPGFLDSAGRVVAVIDREDCDFEGLDAFIPVANQAIDTALKRHSVAVEVELAVAEGCSDGDAASEG